MKWRRPAFGLGIFLLDGVLCLGGQEPPSLPAPVATRQQQFSIPFRVVPPQSHSQEPVEAQLHASTDEGATWRLQGKVDPRQGKFTVRVPSDGEYWFAVRTVDRQGRLRPDRPLTPELRVIVDTSPPTLDVRATRADANRVDVELRVADAHLAADQVRLSYSTGADQPWIPLPTPESSSAALGRVFTGTSTIAGAGLTGELRIRAEAADMAGNPAAHLLIVPAAAMSADLAGNSGPGRAAQQQIIPALDRPGRTTGRLAADGASNWPPDTSGESRWPTQGPLIRKPATQAGAGSAAPPPEDVPVPDLSERERVVSEEPSHRRAEYPAARDSLHEDVNDTWPHQAYDAMPPDPSHGQRFTGPSMVTNQVASGRRWSSLFGSVASPPDPAEVRLVNSTSFELDYDLEIHGSAGIAQVDLWITRDGGRTWLPFVTDEDRRTPVSVNVEGEGLYGFSVVVQSGTGLRGRSPSAGEAPEIWVGVDLRPPTVRLLSVSIENPDESGVMEIRWEAEDELLAQRPISLYHSPSRDGRWTLIATAIDNQGVFHWRLDDRVPEEFFLRVEARDAAGNVTGDVSARPISVARARPKARIRGVRPVRELSRRGRDYRFFQ